MISVLLLRYLLCRGEINKFTHSLILTFHYFFTDHYAFCLLLIEMSIS